MSEETTICRGCNAALDEDGNCKCPPARLARQRSAAAAAKAGAVMRATKAVLRVGCETQHTPEQQAEREKWTAAIEAEHPTVERSLLDGMACTLLQAWGEQAAGRTAARAARRAELQERIHAAGPEIEAAVRAAELATAEKFIASQPPATAAALRSALERGATVAELTKTWGPMAGMVREVYAAGTRMDLMRAAIADDPEGYAKSRQDAADEATFRQAKEDMQSPLSFVRQLAEGKLRRLATAPKGRAELLASIRGSRAADFVSEAELADAPDHALAKLSEERDAPAGWTVGTIKAAHQQAARDRKRKSRANR